MLVENCQDVYEFREPSSSTSRSFARPTGALYNFVSPLPHQFGFRRCCKGAAVLIRACGLSDLSAAPAALWQVTATSPINAVREWFFPAFSKGPLGCDGASYYSLFCQTFALDLQPSTQLWDHRGHVFRSISKGHSRTLPDLQEMR